MDARMGDERRVEGAGKRILSPTRPPTYDSITPTSSRPTHPTYIGATDPHFAFSPAPGRSLVAAYLLCFPLGFLGLHHFYLGRPAFGVLYILTLGVGGVGWLVDFFRMPWLVREANWRLCHPAAGWQSVSVIDAYLMWLPFGIVGLHQYYLRRRIWAVTYTFTLGMFGVGWIIDAFRIPFMVHEIRSRRLELEREPLRATPQQKNLWDLYTLCLSPPFGISGAHHFHLGRTLCGIYYMFSFGGCGVGWIADWFRLKCLADRVNHPERYPLGHRQKFVDDAYVFAFPFGLLGLHHFYLGRPGWGVLYIFTGGLLGIGWLFDLWRMPCLVAGANQRLLSEEALRGRAAPPSGVVIGPTYPITNHGLYFHGAPNTGAFQTPVVVGGVCEGHHAVPHWGETPTVGLQPPSYDTLPSTSNGNSWVSVSAPEEASSAAHGPPLYEPVYSQKRTN